MLRARSQNNSTTVRQLSVFRTTSSFYIHPSAFSSLSPLQFVTRFRAPYEARFSSPAGGVGVVGRG
jgi:hypothetical protein